MARRVWVYVGGRAGNKPQPAEKTAITAACERLLAEVLRPRFLPEIRPSVRFNYPVAIDGKWHGNKYRFFTRYRSNNSDYPAAEFDAAFARLDYVNRDSFDVFMAPAHRRMASRVPAPVPGGSATSDRERAVFSAVLT